MSLPQVLIDKVGKGEIVLLLGSGALYDAKLPDNKKIPFGDDLRDLLADNFLNGEYKDYPLSAVSQLAISEYCLFDVQDYIKEYFECLEPAEYHYKLAQFKWRSIYTTNYDLMVEEVYSHRGSRPKALQKLVKIYSDSNIVDPKKLKDNQLDFYKLHGCISRPREYELPFVLTIEDFNDTLSKNRQNMLKTLYERAINYSIVFIGHSNQDHNIRSIMQDVRKDSPQGQRHYLIKPGAKAAEVRFWETQDITILDIGFEGFLNELDTKVPKTDRVLSLALNSNSNQHPIQKLFITHENPSQNLINLLNTDCLFVHQDLPVGHCNPEDFYKGNVKGWSGAYLDYAIERSLQNKVLRESLKKPEADKEEPVEFIAITGASGTGKTVFLHQLALLLSIQTTSISLLVRHSSVPDIEAISELCNKTSERVYLFWDNLEINKKYVYKFIRDAKSKGLKVSVIGCERSNLWGSQCTELDILSTKIYKLNKMSSDEIDKLLINLERFKVLSPYLQKLTHEDRCLYVEESSNRHLLVALYEITTGKRFEDIVIDEFDRILPKEAQSIYQTICTLNKYNISVRAGLLSRIHKIDFKEFSTRLFKPLENIIYPVQEFTNDIQYISRHPEIANIIDRHVLSTPEIRVNEYLEIIKCLNISYTVDEICFKQLLKSRHMLEIFNGSNDALDVYNFALDVIPDNAYLHQHMALYLNGSSKIKARKGKHFTHPFNEILELLLMAEELAPHDGSIPHSLFIVYKDNVDYVESDIRKEANIREAISYINKMVKIRGKEDSYSASARIDLNLHTLSYDLKNDDDPTKPYIQKQIAECQKLINSYKSRFPEDSYFNELDKRFKRILNDHDGYVKAAQASYDQGHRTPDRAMTLARILSDDGDLNGAIKILKEAIGDNRSNKKLYFQYAELLRKTDKEVQSHILAFNYKRGFNPNDTNYIAQFWFARFAFLSHDKKEVDKAIETFSNLKFAEEGSKAKTVIRDIDMGNDSYISYRGSISKTIYEYGFLNLDNKDLSIYFKKDDMLDKDIWSLLEVGQRLEYNMGYNFFGPTAVNIKVI